MSSSIWKAIDNLTKLERLELINCRYLDEYDFGLHVERLPALNYVALFGGKFDFNGGTKMNNV